MRVVVSGATGFLGGHLCRYLHAQGCEVIALGRNLEAGNRLRDMGMIFEAIDLSRQDDLNSVYHADAFVHAAALSAPWGREIDFRRANVIGTHNALTMADALNVKRFVLISSPSVTFRFAHQLGISERDPLPSPVNAYAATKAEAEELVQARAEVGPVILRPRGIYGPGDTALLPRLLRAAERGAVPLLNGGRAVIDLTYVDDVVRAVTLALKARDSCHARVYNISGGEALAIRDIVEMTAKAAGVTLRFKPVPVALALAAAKATEILAGLMPGQPEPVMTTYGVGLMAYSQTLDIAAARFDLGFTPEIRFAEGLRRTFATERAAA